jgi:hypothetical protein
MKFLSLFLFAATALAQSATPASPSNAQLPIKAGEWKMVAMVHSPDGDVARSFFSCNTATDLAHLVPQPSHLPAGVTCSKDSEQVTDTGVVLTFSCETTSSKLKNTYVLTRNSDTLVTGTMKLIADIGGQHQESTTNIAYQWQSDECTKEESKPAAPQAAPRPAPSLNGPTAPPTTPDSK